MAWLLQTPGNTSPKLLTQIIGECGSALKGGAAFAFGSAEGVKLLAADPGFQQFLKKAEFAVVVGMDAITDARTIDELRRLQRVYPRFTPKLFLHDTAGSCFHPKTMWLKTAQGGVVITGSGNLTTGGLRSNWEALAVQRLTKSEADAMETEWDKWIAEHKFQLLDLDNPKVAERAKANRFRRTAIKKALGFPQSEDATVEISADTAEEAVEEVARSLLLNPVLIAEVPKSGNRWKQVNFDLRTYQGFFGVSKGGPAKHVRFHCLSDDGSLGPPEDRQSVSVKSRNYRFEIGATQGLAYPAHGHPIVIFEKIDQSTFKYVLLLPGKKGHSRIQKYLNTTYIKPGGKLRILVTAGELQKVWPTAPFFL